VNSASIVIGALLGRIDAKIIEISSCFPMTFKTIEKEEKEQEGEKSRKEL